MLWADTTDTDDDAEVTGVQPEEGDRTAASSRKAPFATMPPTTTTTSDDMEEDQLDDDPYRTEGEPDQGELASPCLGGHTTAAASWGPRTTARPKRLPKRPRVDGGDEADPIDSLTHEMTRMKLDMQAQIAATNTQLRTEMTVLVRELLAAHTAEMTKQLTQQVTQQIAGLITPPGPQGAVDPSH